MSQILAVTGFPCSGVPWKGLLGEERTSVVTLADLLQDAGKGDFSSLAVSLNKFMEALPCDVVVAHDLGVTIALIALRRRRRLGLSLPSKVILFNGAFSGFDVLKAPHPFKMQLLTYAGLQRRLGQDGITVDHRLSAWWPQVRQLYRQVIVASILAKLQPRRFTEIKHPIEIPTLILEGLHDPYIPSRCIDELAKLCKNSTRLQAYYGHFPYLGDTSRVQSLIERFLSAQ